MKTDTTKPPKRKSKDLPLNMTDVIGSGFPSFFLGRPLADSTTTRNMAGCVKTPQSYNNDLKKIIIIINKDRLVERRRRIQSKQDCRALASSLPHHWIAHRAEEVYFQALMEHRRAGHGSAITPSRKTRSHRGHPPADWLSLNTANQWLR